MLIVSGSYQCYHNGAVSNQLTDVLEESVSWDDSESVDV
jgi:hypothetical protein